MDRDLEMDLVVGLVGSRLKIYLREPLEVKISKEGEEAEDKEVVNSISILVAMVLEMHLDKGKIRVDKGDLKNKKKLILMSAKILSIYNRALCLTSKTYMKIGTFSFIQTMIMMSISSNLLRSSVYSMENI